MPSIFRSSLNLRVYGGFGLIVLLMLIAVATIMRNVLNTQDQLEALTASAGDSQIASRLDIDLTTFNLIFRRFMLSDNDTSLWERAQRVFGGLETTIADARATMTDDERKAVAETIAANAQAIRAAAGEIAQMTGARQALVQGPLGADLDALDIAVVDRLRAAGASADALALSEAWRAAQTATQTTLRFPSEDNAAAAVAAYRMMRAASQAAPIAGATQQAMAAAETAISDYVALHARESALVGSALNALAFETGGLAEAVRIAAGEDQAAAIRSAEAGLPAMAAFSVGMLAVTIILAMILSILMARSVVRPLVNIKRAMLNVAEGDLETTIPEINRPDEIGDMARATEVFRESVERTQRMERDAAEAEAKQREALRQKQLEMVETVESTMGSVIADLCGSADELKRLSLSLTGDAGQTNELSLTMGAAADEAGASVSTVAAAVEEMAVALSAMTGSVNDVSSRASGASNEAKDAESALDALQDAIADIIAIVESINAVAEQTNLLALNATIEAARAGDAGKGFAVVASEVKALADQTRKMTDEISSQVTSVERTSQDAIKRTRVIVEQVGSIDFAITGIKDSVQQQDAATIAIRRAAQDASTESTSLSSDVQLVQGAAENMNAACLKAVDAVDLIVTNANQAQDQMNVVLNAIRAA